jgi:spore coat polysaccharide biosynthesis predicted glycosyltransferase SpsG
LVAAGAAHEGRGHVARTLAVAEALIEAGANVEIEVLGGELTALERRRVVRSLSGPRQGPGGSPDAVVLDLPQPGSAAARFDRKRLVVFDDRGSFDGRASIVIQPSLPEWTGGGQVGRVLSGYAYAPIASTYVELRKGPAHDRSEHRDTRPRVVVCFGGSDPADVLGRIGPALGADPRWLADIIVGAGYRGTAEAWSTPVLRDPADLPDRLAAADLAVIGAGTMKFEVACLGVPAILLAAADDQLEVAPLYAATGVARYLGDGRTTDPEIVRAAVARLLDDHQLRSRMAVTARDLIDGLGAARIAEWILLVARGGELSTDSPGLR